MKITQKLIVLFLIIALLVPSFFLWPKEAQAQISGGGGIQIGGLASVIMGCSGAGDKIKNFFKSKDLKGKSKKSIDEDCPPETTMGDKVADKGKGTGEVPTFDATVTEEIRILQCKEEAIKKELRTQREKETCLDAIAYYAAKEAIRMLGMNIINWINGESDGFAPFSTERSAFVKNPQTFFKDLYEREISGLANIISGLGNPFGRDALKGLATSALVSIEDRFKENARFTLNEFIREGSTYEDYYVDFSVGGWDAWMAMTQIPANNPIGFRFMVTEEAARRTVGAEFSIFEEIQTDLQQGQGFLSFKICTEQVTEIEIDGKTEKRLINRGDTSNVYAGQWNNEMSWDDPMCTNWENATPGQTVANQLNITLGTKQSQLELADELNEVIAAVFDALIERLTSEGVSAIEYGDDGNIGDAGGYTYHRGEDGEYTDEYTSEEIAAFLSPEEETDLADEIPYLIYLQKRYIGDINISPITVQDGELYLNGKPYIDPDTIIPPTGEYQGDWDASANTPILIADSGVEGHYYVVNTAGIRDIGTGDLDFDVGDWVIYNGFFWEKSDPGHPGDPYADPAPGYGGLPENNIKLSTIIEALYQLDYCVPGPHPGWEEEAAFKTQKILEQKKVLIETLDQSGEFSQKILDTMTNIYNGMLRKYADKIREKFNSGNMIMGTFTFVDESIGEIKRIGEYQTIINTNDEKIKLVKQGKGKLEFLLEQVKVLVNDTVDDEDQVEEFDNLRKIFLKILPQIVSADHVSDAMNDKIIYENDYSNILDPSIGLLSRCEKQTDPATYTGPSEKRPHPFVGGSVCYPPNQSDIHDHLEDGDCSFLPEEDVDVKDYAVEDIEDVDEDTNEAWVEWLAIILDPLAALDSVICADAGKLLSGIRDDDFSKWEDALGIY